jgi:G:T-mismatch repair DNA endonuclease (very short patch repair protein)
MRLSERMHRDRRFIVALAGLGWRIHIAFSAL